MLPPLVLDRNMEDINLYAKISQMENITKIKDALLKEYEKLISAQNKKIKDLTTELDLLKK
jgi:hypothetical protein